MSDEQARRVFRQLQALARADDSGSTGALLVVYGVEGFLRRLAASQYASNAAVVGEIIATELDLDDGLEFDADSIRTEVMRENAGYQGVRVKLIANLATAAAVTLVTCACDPQGAGLPFAWRCEAVIRSIVRRAASVTSAIGARQERAPDPAGPAYP